ncbi:hypothetical protein SASPL_155871 [Salvia splendens]|uniref:Myb-like domain-containing protein n=1 Tax=Salvia splendens TaxID=180675 RepID=A0A8X8VXP8_SALSN|nr:hypothetical protein SASPL_155871 [Salvia splendens]
MKTAPTSPSPKMAISTISTTLSGTLRSGSSNPSSPTTEFSPHSESWSEDEIFGLLEVWGERYVELGRPQPSRRGLGRRDGEGHRD